MVVPACPPITLTLTLTLAPCTSIPRVRSLHTHSRYPTRTIPFVCPHEYDTGCPIAIPSVGYMLPPTGVAFTVTFTAPALKVRA